MITVGMLRNLLEHLPDDMYIEVSGKTITDYSVLGKNIDGKERGILEFHLCNLAGIVLDIIDLAHYNKKQFTLHEIILMIKNNDYQSNLFYNTPLNDAVREMFVQRLEDNYTDIKTCINNIFESQDDTEYNVAYNTLKVLLNKIL